MRHYSVLSLCLGAGVLFFATLGCLPAENRYSPPPPPPVRYIKPRLGDVVIFVEEAGETASVGRAEVRSRVKGIIRGIEFAAGQQVEKESLLYTIEDDSYRVGQTAAAAEVAAAEASILVARANVAVTLAAVEQTKSEFARQTQLMEQRATSQAEYDRAKANLDSANANVDAAQAAVTAADATLKQAQAKLENAQLELSYTQIRAPIAGRVTQSRVEVGNLIDVGTSLVSIIDAQNIYVNFTISDRDALALLEYRTPKAGNEVIGPERWSKTPILLAREADSQFRFEGRMEYVAQEGVDTATGTLRLRGLFDNSQGELLPGLFVRVRVPVAIGRNLLLIPQSAIIAEALGKFVLVINDKNQADKRFVRLGPERDGWVAIEEGVHADDRIILDGHRLALQGEITPKEYTFRDEELPQPYEPQVTRWFDEASRNP